MFFLYSEVVDNYASLSEFVLWRLSEGITKCNVEKKLKNATLSLLLPQHLRQLTAAAAGVCLRPVDHTLQLVDHAP